MIAIVRVPSVRKHRAPKGALRHMANLASSTTANNSRQKAPSAKRCIKTPPRPLRASGGARRQKAPSAKRCTKTRGSHARRCEGCAGQKAPSTKRCIKTCLSPLSRERDQHCQKAPSAKRCIKTFGDFFGSQVVFGSESTELPKSRMQFPRARINTHQETAESQRSDFKT